MGIAVGSDINGGGVREKVNGMIGGSGRGKVCLRLKEGGKEVDDGEHSGVGGLGGRGLRAHPDVEKFIGTACLEEMPELGSADGR